MEIAPGVYRVHIRDDSLMHVGGNSVYLVGGARRLLVDAGDGDPTFTQLILDAIGTLGCQVSQIVLTHHHSDHWGSAKEIVAATGARVWAHPLTIAEIRKSDTSLPLEPLEDGETLEADGVHLQAIFTPGHAVGHLCYFLPERGCLFTGDTILGMTTTTVVDLEDYMNSLHRLLELPARLICPAHGPLVENPREKILEYIEHRLMRERQILEQLSTGPKTSWEMVQVIYHDVDQRLHRAAERNVLTHLRQLEQEGRVRPLPSPEVQPLQYELIPRAR